MRIDYTEKIRYYNRIRSTTVAFCTVSALSFIVSSAEGPSFRKSQFLWDNIVIGTSSNKRPLLTELWDKPFTKRPTSPCISIKLILICYILCTERFINSFFEHKFYSDSNLELGNFKKTQSQSLLITHIFFIFNECPRSICFCFKQ